MKSEEIKCCIGKEVKVVLDNNYILRGKIDNVSEDSIFFSTPDKKSIISIDVVREIVF